MAFIPDMRTARLAAKIEAMAYIVVADALMTLRDLYRLLTHGRDYLPANDWLMGMHYVSRCKHRIGFRGYDCYHGMRLSYARWVRAGKKGSPPHESEAR